MDLFTFGMSAKVFISPSFLKSVFRTLKVLLHYLLARITSDEKSAEISAPLLITCRSLAASNAFSISLVLSGLTRLMSFPLYFLFIEFLGSLGS